MHAELADWDRKIEARTDELLALTRENTACLNAVSDMTSAQRKLEATLTSARTSMFSDPMVARKQVRRRWTRARVCTRVG